jgi:hypothetical protein
LAIEPLVEEETSGKCTKVSFRWITLFVKNIYNLVALLASGDKERPTMKEQKSSKQCKGRNGRVGREVDVVHGMNN